MFYSIRYPHSYTQLSVYKKNTTSLAVSECLLLGVWIFWILICIVGPFFFYYRVADTPDMNLTTTGFINLGLNFVMLFPSILYCIFTKNPFTEE